ncbi:MAG: NAD(P)-binding domain-containing protein [Pyrinomonadaceae bacterium]
MKVVPIVISLAIIGLLIWLNQGNDAAETGRLGGLSLLGWASIVTVTLMIGFVAIFRSSLRSALWSRRDVIKTHELIRKLTLPELKELRLDKYRGPAYPHPVIFPERCIGCQACVDACPHDVLAIVDGVAAAVAPDLCMEDTACQAECPVNPKACIVINTAKEVRSLPTPTRDGATFQTNVPGCYIIGDVSGVPLIKNAVKEGAEVAARVANDLKDAPAEPKADFDVAIIGIGPGGASAAAAASEAGLRYIAIEQDKILSTIDLYPKGKYIFFKPDTKDWVGGLSVAGLGLAKAKYGGEAPDDSQEIVGQIPELTSLITEHLPAIRQRLIDKIPANLHPELYDIVSDKLQRELTKRIALYLRGKGQGNWPEVYSLHFAPDSDRLISEFSDEIVDRLETKIPGDQRENILNVWLGTLAQKGVQVNENESCKSVTPAGDGDYFVINTEQGAEKTPQAYNARRVVIAIGLRGAPNKLRLTNEDLKASIDGRKEAKVIYGLSSPMDFRNKNIVVVGGGNVAVEAAVDLVAVRDGAAFAPRAPADMNRVTLLVRDYLAPTVKFGNKLQLYTCADDGLIDLRFGVGIKEMREHELVLEDVKTKKVVATIPNDYVFALIGGERPNRFLESIGITIA